MKKEKLMLLFALSLYLLSCKREQPAADNCTLTMQHIAGTYQVTSMLYQRSPNAVPQDYLAFVEACEKDDFINFQADSSFILTDAGIKCQPTGDSRGKWSINGKTLKMEGSEDAIVENFDCRSLVIYTVDQIIPGDKLTITLTRK